MNKSLFLSHQSLLLILLLPLSVLTTQKVHAGAIEIAIDPYNDSEYKAIPIENSSNSLTNNSTGKTNLPLNNTEISTDSVYYVKGNSTPPPPTIINGNLVTSNKTLPAIPPLGEPYSQQQNAEVNPSNITSSNNLSVSVSPFNITPQENKSINTPSSPPITNTVNVNNNNNNVRTIDLSPRNSASINSNSDNSSTSDLDKRRNLREILVFSAPSNPVTSENKNNGNNQPSVSLMPSTVNNSTVYKVLAQISNNNQETGVKSLYPEAFKTNYQGKSLLQVGVFSTKERAEQVSQSLANIGVKAIILQ